LAILMPKLDNLNEQIGELITHSQYLETINNRNK